MRNEKLRAALSDPLRALLTARPGRCAALGMLAAMAAVYAAALMHLCAEMEGAGIIALVSALSMLLVTGFAWRVLRGERPEAMVLLCTALLSMLAVGVHVAMLDIKPGRYTGVLAPMLGEMWNYDLLTAMAWEEGSWSGVYLIVMALVSRLEGFSALYALKLIDLVCLCLASGAVLQLARLRGATAQGAAAAMFACLLAPTMLMNSGLWLHCDAIFAMLTLWGLALLLKEHPLAGCVLLGLALATKLQSAFVFPLLIVLFLLGRVQLRHLLALAAAALFSQAAILLDGQGLTALVGRYAAQLEEARGTIGLADGAPGVYGLMKVASVREFSGMGLYFGIACVLLVVLALLRAKKPLDHEALLLTALLLACGLPLVLPQMNARSLYLAGMLAFALAGNARRMAAAGLLELLSLCAYIRAVFSHEIMPMPVLSLLAIAAAVLVLTELLAALRGRDKGATRA